MGSDIVYMSAPYERCGSEAAEISWDALKPFQPLLGQDAQMAAFSVLAHRDNLQLRVLAAPEIYGNLIALDRLRLQVTDRVLAHVRFGTSRLPRLLKMTANLVLLTEDTTLPTALGRHPFAAGAALPAAIRAVLLDDTLTPVPERIGADKPPVVMLPPGFGQIEKPAANDTAPSTTALQRVTLQSCSEYQSAAWRRSAPPHAGARVLSERTAVLLPWNLAGPGSLVPETLRRVKLLAGQGRFPLTIIVLPYNDVPGSLTKLEEVTESCTEALGREAIVLARAGSIGDSLALLKRCRRAWIDTADPEWRWTLRRMTACGLPVNFLTSLAQDVAAVYDPSSFTPDELVTRETQGRTGRLFWRIRMLSLPRLASLADAVEHGTDGPFRPESSVTTNALDEPRLRHLLRTA